MMIHRPSQNHDQCLMVGNDATNVVLQIRDSRSERALPLIYFTRDEALMVVKDMLTLIERIDNHTKGKAPT